LLSHRPAPVATLTGIAAGLIFLLALTSACRNQKTQAPPRPARAASVLPEPLLAGTWALRMAADSERAPYENHPGWAILVMRRDYPAALGAFTQSPALADGQFRVHLELAAAYRQAAILASQATLALWRDDPREEDPGEVTCLIGISEALLAMPDQARSHLDACTSASMDLERSVLAWKAVIHEKAALIEGPRPDLLATSCDRAGLEFPAPTPGISPDVGAGARLAFRDRVDGREVPTGDPTILAGLAVFHERAALLAISGQKELVSAFLDPWRLPVETMSRAQAGDRSDAASTALSVPDALLFGSTFLGAGDLVFLSDASNHEGAEAVGRHAADSPLAATLQPCVDAAKPTIDVDCVVSRASALQEQVRTAMAGKGGGQQGFHRIFAALARVSVLRAAERLARRIGDEQAQGLLVIDTLDLSADSAAEPYFLLAAAAFDASNRNTTRAEDLLHGQEGHMPGVEIARYPLDALHVRISRESGPELPMH
jgi:hypothetical protein